MGEAAGDAQGTVGRRRRTERDDGARQPAQRGRGGHERRGAALAVGAGRARRPSVRVWQAPRAVPGLGAGRHHVASAARRPNTAPHDRRPDRRAARAEATGRVPARAPDAGSRRPGHRSHAPRRSCATRWPTPAGLWRTPPGPRVGGRHLQAPARRRRDGGSTRPRQLRAPRGAGPAGRRALLAPGQDLHRGRRGPDDGDPRPGVVSAPLGRQRALRRGAAAPVPARTAGSTCATRTSPPTRGPRSRRSSTSSACRATAPFTDDRTARLHPNHIVAGNPSRFTTGDVTIRSDDAWTREMPLRDQRLVAGLTLPLLFRYGYVGRGKARS